MAKVEKLTDESIMPWGIYQGKTMEEVPDNYLLAMYEKDRVRGKVKIYIEENLDAIKKNLGR